MTVKRSVDELFMHYFQNIRRLLGALSQTPNLPTPGKILPSPMLTLIITL